MSGGMQHLDEARSALEASLKDSWSTLGLRQTLIIEDSFGRFSLGLWGDRAREGQVRELLDAIQPFGAGMFWAPAAEEFDPMELEPSWDEGRRIDPEWDDKIRLVVRHRMLPAWQTVRENALWKLADGPGLVAFYSFKGGMGRSTALAAFALERARHDEHVVVVDLDLDAPGLGSLFGAEIQPPYGVVDYLIETPVLGHPPEDILDYSYRFQLDGIRTSGSLRVIPAGRLDGHYLGKMARLDFEPVLEHPLETLLNQVREEWNPDWILLDSRTGFSETAGMLLSGLAHFHVLVGVDSEQSWQGLGHAVRKLGEERVLRNLPQSEVMLIHGLLPPLPKDARDELKARFQERARDLFEEGYYADLEEERNEDYWYQDDADGQEAPHRPCPLEYVPALAQSATVADMLDALDNEASGYPGFCRELNERVRRLR